MACARLAVVTANLVLVASIAPSFLHAPATAPSMATAWAQNARSVLIWLLNCNLILGSVGLGFRAKTAQSPRTAPMDARATVSAGWASVRVTQDSPVPGAQKWMRALRTATATVLASTGAAIATQASAALTVLFRNCV